MKRSYLAREIVEILALTILIFIAVRFVIQSYHVDGQSMEPGLITNDYVMVNKLAYLSHGPERGDVIVFHYPLDTKQDYIKRVIGLPGDKIQVNNTQVIVNGHVLNEPYITTPYNQEANAWTVPPNEYFVLGDNRPVSLDSRSWGFVPRSYIIGKAVVVFWHQGKPELHFINTYPAVYKELTTS
ncbi:MAG TPA: signal peptidase I [Dictyobacter sp.]|nr:signal peptidase I [Dictyobacter sp.]